MPGFTGFYWVLLGINELDWVLFRHHGEQSRVALRHWRRPGRPAVRGDAADRRPERRRLPRPRKQSNRIYGNLAGEN